MDARPKSLAASLYRKAAALIAHSLGSSPGVESVLVFRSVATGEVTFGRSDIDLMVVLRQEDAGDGAKVAALYRKVRRLHRLNPAMGHVVVCDPSGIERLARLETYWNSTEQRSAMVLHGAPTRLPAPAVEPDHAVGYLGPLLEVFLSTVIQLRLRRHIRKTALDAWNIWATASGLIPEPYLKRGEIEGHMRAIDGSVSADRFEDPQAATDYVFQLAERMHAARRPALRKLAGPVIFESLTPPQALRRTLVVLPGPGSPLPPEAFRRGALLWTPESLDLYLRYTNAFFFWILPRQLLDLGIEQPTAAEFRFSCLRYGNSRILRHPGFTIPFSHTGTAIVANVRHAAEWLVRGDVPPPPPQGDAERIVAEAPSSLDYYRNVYPRVYAESARLREELAGASRSRDA